MAHSATAVRRTDDCRSGGAQLTPRQAHTQRCVSPQTTLRPLCVAGTFPAEVNEVFCIFYIQRPRRRALARLAQEGWCQHRDEEPGFGIAPAPGWDVGMSGCASCGSVGCQAFAWGSFRVNSSQRDNTSQGRSAYSGKHAMGTGALSRTETAQVHPRSPGRDLPEVTRVSSPGPTLRRGAVSTHRLCVATSGHASGPNQAGDYLNTFLVHKAGERRIRAGILESHTGGG